MQQQFHLLNLQHQSPLRFFNKIEEKTSTIAKIIFQKKSKKDKVPVAPSQGLITAIHVGMYLWDTPDFPSNLNMFFCECLQLTAFSRN